MSEDEIDATVHPAPITLCDPAATVAAAAFRHQNGDRWLPGVDEKTVTDLRLIGQLAAQVRCSAFIAEEKWGSTLSLPRGFFETESFEFGKVMWFPKRLTSQGELVWVDYGVFDDIATRERIRSLLTREIEPFIIGVGEVRVVGKEGFDGLVVRMAETDHGNDCHP